MQMFVVWLARTCFILILQWDFDPFVYGNEVQMLMQPSIGCIYIQSLLVLSVNGLSRHLRTRIDLLQQYLLLGLPSGVAALEHKAENVKNLF